MPFAPPADLTVPRSESTTTYELLSKYLSAQFRTLTQLPRIIRVPQHVVDLEHLVAQVRSLAGKDPGLLFSVLRRPSVGGPLRCLYNQRQGASERVHYLVSLFAAQLYFELAVDGVDVESGPIALGPSSLIALGARRTLKLDGGLQSVEFKGTRLTMQGISGSRELNLTPADAEQSDFECRHPSIRDDLVLALVDNNPQSDLEAHPEKSGNAVDLGGKSVEEWLASLQEALEMVAHFLPELDREIQLVAHQIVPVGYDPERHMSASYQEVIGNIYMTLHPDPLTLAEAIVHEFSHNKLNMLFSLDAVLENAFYPLFASPIRPDPRPLHGVLLAVHAFLPVERMYERMVQEEHPLSGHPRFKQRLQKVRENNQAAADTLLKNGHATPIGQGVLDEIADWNAYFAAGGLSAGANAPH